MRSNFWGAKGISNQTFIDPTIAGFRLCRPRVDPRLDGAFENFVAHCRPPEVFEWYAERLTKDSRDPASNW